VILRNATSSRLRAPRKLQLMSGSQMPLPTPYNTGHNLLWVGCSALRAGKHSDRLRLKQAVCDWLTYREQAKDLSCSHLTFLTKASRTAASLRTIRSAPDARDMPVKSSLGVNEVFLFLPLKMTSSASRARYCLTEEAVANMHSRLNQVTDMHRISADPGPIIPPTGRARVGPTDKERCKVCCRSLAGCLSCDISEDDVR
jgi:hypothetical protein